MCGCFVDFVVECDDVVECWGWVGLEGFCVCVGWVVVDCDVVWVCMFDDYVGWCVECFYVFLCCVWICDVVVW